MDIGDYYSKSIESFRRNWKITVPSIVASILTVLLFTVGFFGVMATLSPNLSIMWNFKLSIFSQINLNTLLTAGMILLIIEILIFVINAFRTAATVGMAKQIIMDSSASLDIAWKDGIKYFPKIFVVSLIKMILMVIVAIPLILSFYLLFNNMILGGISLLLAGSLIFFTGYILISLIFFVFNQSIVVGQKSVIGSIKDSYNIFWNNKLTVFLVALINGVISLVIGFILGIIFTPLAVVAGPLATQISGLLVSIILVPYFALVMTYMYMELKMGFQWINGDIKDHIVSTEK
ncbi:MULTISPECIES: DUF7847 domain-containing protein [Methanobacterium]|uniref:Glycerophosphoryl diester phosphodiesterase membrane domain-containing protein n=1 Tax=Methanobacterium bryantii TaxID=2161 RepID=A0A2A2H5S8_METBR|nr:MULTISPECIES: hypothetical protein [Methanobacterium]OEC88743.1 hypothetical protein A9507_03410 [Methanobacterium sp. A39]PAV04752.1 hypothetical protein ASJ80_10575 [Methanobacterium bryantii]